MATDTNPQSPGQPAGANPNDPPKSGPAEALSGLSGLYTAAAQNGVSPQMTDAITQALLMILGSGPSIAAFDSLLSVQQANGIMYHNAVSHQQKTNLLGMAMTAKCVRYMLDPSTADSLGEAILDEEMGG
jgi:Killing trait